MGKKKKFAHDKMDLEKQSMYKWKHTGNARCQGHTPNKLYQAQSNTQESRINPKRHRQKKMVMTKNN